jgi:hypothetical protein
MISKRSVPSLDQAVQRAAVGARDRLRGGEDGLQQPVDVALGRQRRADRVQLLQALHQVVGRGAPLAREAEHLRGVDDPGHAGDALGPIT